MKYNRIRTRFIKVYQQALQRAGVQAEQIRQDESMASSVKEGESIH